MAGLVVVIDASALFLPFQFKVDLEAEASRVLGRAPRFLVPAAVVREIEGVLREGRGPSKRHAKAALQYAARFPTAASRGEGDDAVLNAAIDARHAGEQAVVATLDTALRRRARAFRVPVLFLRAKHHLELDGYLA